MFFPFILAFIIAYLLNPYVTALEKVFPYRSMSITIIMMVFISIVAALIAIVAPTLYHECLNFIKNVPSHLDFLRIKLHPYMPILKEYAGDKDISDIGPEFYQGFVKLSMDIIGKLWNSAIAIANLAIVLIITPPITFYLLKDWNSIIHAVYGLIPRKHHHIVMQLLKKINHNLSAYIRGQLKLCCILAIFYASMLSVARLEYSIFIGIMTGVLSFIPYAGMITGITVSHLVAISQFDNIYSVLTITVIYAAGQFLESIILTPRLIGKSVDLHPVWIIFAVIAGADLFGFSGVLLAIPFASILSVMVKFMISLYKRSKLYEDKTIIAHE